jgi:hypothetical protein
MKTAPADFDVAADELYRLRPDEFTTARNAKVAEARASGNRKLAEAIKDLRRPTVSAWLANWLVHDRPDEFARLLSLGASMRDASDRLAGDEMRRLAPQRHQVLATLMAEARQVASAAGVPISNEVSSELEGTLAAALSDEEAADELRAGRLTAALRYTGFGSPGSTPVTKTTGTTRRNALTAEPRRVEPGPQKKPTNAKRTSSLRSAQRTLKEAETAVSAARREAGKRHHIADKAQARRDELRGLINELEVQLDDLRAQEMKAASETAAAVEDRDVAEEAVRTAEQRVSEARRRLDSL